MFKLNRVLGVARSTNNQPHTDLMPLTVEQAMAVSAGTTETKENEKPQAKPTVTTSTSTTSSSDPLPNSVGRPPFN